MRHHMRRMVVALLMLFVLSMTLSVLAQDAEATPEAMPPARAGVPVDDLPLMEGEPYARLWRQVAGDVETFSDARHIVGDAEGFFYTMDFQRAEVFAYNPDGKLDGRFIPQGDTPITDMAMAPDGTLYIVRSGDILRYERDGTLVDVIAGSFPDVYYTLVDVTEGGKLVALSLFANEDDRVSYFADDGSALPGGFSLNEALNMGDINFVSTGFTLDAEDNLILSIEESIISLTQEGDILKQYDNVMDFPIAGGIAWDNEGNLLIGGAGSITIVAPNGTIRGVVRMPEIGFVYGLSLDASGEVLYASQAETAYVMLLLANEDDGSRRE
jgi:hypothetical protein